MVVVRIHFGLRHATFDFINVSFICVADKTACDKLSTLQRSLFVIAVLYVRDVRQWKRKYWDNGPCENLSYMRCPCERCQKYIEEVKKSAIPSDLLAFARYFEATTESTPQWCLQNYVMLRK